MAGPVYTNADLYAFLQMMNGGGVPPQGTQQTDPLYQLYLLQQKNIENRQEVPMPTQQLAQDPRFAYQPTPQFEMTQPEYRSPEQIQANYYDNQGYDPQVAANLIQTQSINEINKRTEERQVRLDEIAKEQEDYKRKQEAEALKRDDQATIDAKERFFMQQYLGAHAPLGVAQATAKKAARGLDTEEDQKALEAAVGQEEYVKMRKQIAVTLLTHPPIIKTLGGGEQPMLLSEKQMQPYLDALAPAFGVKPKETTTPPPSVREVAAQRKANIDVPPPAQEGREAIDYAMAGIRGSDVTNMNPFTLPALGVVKGGKAIVDMFQKNFHDIPAIKPETVAFFLPQVAKYSPELRAQAITNLVNAKAITKAEAAEIMRQLTQQPQQPQQPLPRGGGLL